jgi:hypothetical protein
MENSILLQNLSTEQLTDLIGNVFDTKLKAFQENQITASTLWHWQNKGRITVYKFANKCYYKRSELMATITPLNK